MADVFLSYARADRARIETLVAALESAGIDIWWDRRIDAGSEFTADIERELRAAKAVIVAWSAAGSASTWVRDEASLAKNLGTLVPVSLDGAEPPLGFQQFHVADLSGWRGGADAGGIGDLVATLRRRIAPDAAPPEPPATALKARSALKTPHTLAIVAALAATAIAAFLALRPAREPPAEAPAASVEAEAAQTGAVGLAVLPFANFSSDPEQEYFADGLTEEILNWLGNVEGLRVPGRTTSFQYKGKAGDMRAIGDALGVAYLLEGSVRRSGDALRITAQLIDAKSGDHLWSETYDRTLADIFAIQDDIARTVVTELLGKIPETGADNPAAVGEVDPKAHELYLEGRAAFATRNWSVALDKLREAIAIDPRHAFAQAYVAVILSSRRAHGSPDKYDAEIANALAEAVRLKPNAADVIFAEAWVAEHSSGNPPGSRITDRSVIETYGAAVRANPRHVEALHALARADTSPEKQIPLLERILEIDPGHSAARGNLIMATMAIGDRAKAALLIRQGLVSAPGPRWDYAARAKILGDLPLLAEAAFGDWEALRDTAFLRMAAGALLADLGAVPEGRFLYLTAERTIDAAWRGYPSVAAATLAGDAADELAAAQAFYSAEENRRYSARMLAGARIRAGDYAGAYEVIAQRRPDIVKGSLVEGSKFWDEFADLEYVTAAHALDLAGRRDEARKLWSIIVDDYRNHPAEAGEIATWPDFLHLALNFSRAGDMAQAQAFFRQAYEAGFRFPVSYGCIDCVDDGFSAEHGLFAPLMENQENRALLERIKAENAKTLDDVNRQYGVLDKVRAMMAADAAPAAAAKD